MRVWFIPFSQGPTGPKGEAGHPGPPGPPVSSLRRLESGDGGSPDTEAVVGACVCAVHFPELGGKSPGAGGERERACACVTVCTCACVAEMGSTQQGPWGWVGAVMSQIVGCTPRVTPGWPCSLSVPVSVLGWGSHTGRHWCDPTVCCPRLGCRSEGTAGRFEPS